MNRKEVQNYEEMNNKKCSRMKIECHILFQQEKLFLKNLEPMHLEHCVRLTTGFHGYRLFMQVQPYVETLDGRKKQDY